MKRSVATWLLLLAFPLRIYLGVVFLLACWYKLLVPQEFALSIATYNILPDYLVHLMAIVLPWIELVVGVTIIVGFWTRASALTISGMMLMFIVALAIALANDLHMSCGCFASSEAGEEINVMTLFRDLFWLAAGVYVVIVDNGQWGVDGWWRSWARL